MRAALLVVIGAVLVVAACDPPPDDDNPIFPCPGAEGTVVLGANGRCRCIDDEQSISYDSLYCDACDSQDAAGRYCTCGAGEAIDMQAFGDVSACRDRDSQDACGPDAFADNAGQCRPCTRLGGVGDSCGSCGPCPLGLTCLNGTCNALVECRIDVPAACGSMPSACFLVGPSYAAGGPCYCDVPFGACPGRFFGVVHAL